MSEEILASSDDELNIPRGKNIYSGLNVFLEPKKNFDEKVMKKLSKSELDVCRNEQQKVVSTQKRKRRKCEQFYQLNSQQSKVYDIDYNSLLNLKSPTLRSFYNKTLGSDQRFSGTNLGIIFQPKVLKKMQKWNSNSSESENLSSSSQEIEYEHNPDEKVSMNDLFSLDPSSSINSKVKDEELKSNPSNFGKTAKPLKIDLSKIKDENSDSSSPTIKS